MKTISITALSLMLLLAACAPATSATPTAESNQDAVRVPVEAEECIITPHELLSQGIPIPVALAVTIPGNQGLDLFWRDGTAMGNWPTGVPYPISNMHVATPITDDVEAAPLVFLSSSEEGLASLQVSLGGEVTTLMEFPREIQPTGLIGIPSSSLIALSTLQPSQDGTILTSRITISDYRSIATAQPALVTESTQSQYAIPVAIHIVDENVVDGLWYTYNLWGIGGDSLTDARAGLYFLDLSSGESIEFLGMGCQFSALNTGQNYAAWIGEGAMHATDLQSGTTAVFPLLPGNDRAARATFCPCGGYISWLEGKGWEYDGDLETTLRFSSIDGTFMADYPLASLAEPAGLNGEIGMVPLGWMAPDDEVLLVAVYEAGSDQTSLVTINVNWNQVSFLLKGVFAGFAYP